MNVSSQPSTLNPRQRVYRQASPFKDGDIVAFYGDSITHGGLYYTYMWEYYLTRYPAAKITFYNAGIAGDNATDAQPRFERDVASRNPTAVSVMFGMNDVGLNLYSGDQTDRVIESRKEAIERYRKNLVAIDALVAKTGAKNIYRLTPTPYDDTAVIETAATRFLGVNAALGKMVEVVREHTAANGGTLIDFHTVMNAYNREKQEVDPKFTIVGPDRVHPQEPGHLLMAYTFLKAQNADGLVSDIGLDFKRKEVEKSIKADVSDVQWTQNSIEFTVHEESIPMPLDEKALPLLADIPVVRDLNQQILQMRSLRRGQWGLEIDGCRVGEWNQMEWERGINLAMNAKTPMFVQARKVHDAVFARRAEELRFVSWKAVKWWLDGQRVDSDNWIEVEKFWNAVPNRQGYFEGYYPDFHANWDNRAEQEAKIEAATEVCRAAAKTISHRYRIFFVSENAPETILSEQEKKVPEPIEFHFESTVVVQGTQRTSAKAVEDFNEIVCKVTGRKFEVMQEGQNIKSAKKRIYIGRGPEFDEFIVGWWVDQTYGEGESVVLMKNGDLCLFGKDERGSLNAVYDFCEDNLGYDRETRTTDKKADIVYWNGTPTRRQKKD